MNQVNNLYGIAEAHATERSDLNLFFLIDSSGVPGMRSKLRCAAVSWVELIDPDPNVVEFAVPILVTAVNAGKVLGKNTFYKWLDECSIYSSTICTVSTALSITDLHRRLAARMHAKLSGNVEVLLRFYDPRVFESMMSILTPQQLVDFLSPAEGWGYIDRCGEFVEQKTRFIANDPFIAPLLLDQTQEDCLINASTPDWILRRLRVNAATLIAKIPLKEQYDQVKLAYNLALRGRTETASASDLVLDVAAILSAQNSLDGDDEILRFSNNSHLNPQAGFRAKLRIEERNL